MSTMGGFDKNKLPPPPVSARLAVDVHSRGRSYPGVILFLTSTGVLIQFFDQDGDSQSRWFDRVTLTTSFPHYTSFTYRE